VIFFIDFFLFHKFELATVKLPQSKNETLKRVHTQEIFLLLL